MQWRVSNLQAVVINNLGEEGGGEIWSQEN